ncbi:trihelix transcription factor GT-3b-like [Macadamia integrifolia]|uniref:trihelix transcription factor GT-3b-like n=1 Tax=Macadamia integrifolia TaxID=60698 RepID=UPI001C4F5091|nr:trihelix transcription factor GT-3b-like [Macadamia integrifolia]
MEGGHPHPHPHHHHHHHHHHLSVNMVDTGDRFPQWSLQETKEFLSIRADLDRTFMETKRNKLLWEVISSKMKERGYTRSPEQCKCKWKNLVTRYKGCETMETESMRQQFPFYNELQAIFTARMQRMLWLEAEGGGGGGSAAAAAGGRSKKKGVRLSSDDEEDNEESDEDNKVSSKKKRKGKTTSTTTSGGGSSNSNNLQEILEEFMRQQIQMEVQWREAVEAREEEGRVKEMEWRQTMEALENERLMMDRRWREREEQRQMREESRAEKRDVLITTLLNKLRREDKDL